MSGLSLALMMASNEDDCTGEYSMIQAKNEEKSVKDSCQALRQDGNNERLPDDEETAEEKARRAALHQMPPHLLEQPLPVATAAMSGDYGYGYNNHIPWQKIHPSNSNPAIIQPNLMPANSFGRTLSTSPGSVNFTPMPTIHSPPPTPPGAAFFGLLHLLGTALDI